MASQYWICNIFFATDFPYLRSKKLNHLFLYHYWINEVFLRIVHILYIHKYIYVLYIIIYMIYNNYIYIIYILYIHVILMNTHMYTYKYYCISNYFLTTQAFCSFEIFTWSDLRQWILIISPERQCDTIIFIEKDYHHIWHIYLLEGVHKSVPQVESNNTEKQLK